MDWVSIEFSRNFRNTGLSNLMQTGWRNSFWIVFTWFQHAHQVLCFPSVTSETKIANCRLQTLSELNSEGEGTCWALLAMSSSLNAKAKARSFPCVFRYACSVCVFLLHPWWLMKWFVLGSVPIKRLVLGPSQRDWSWGPLLNRLISLEDHIPGSKVLRGGFPLCCPRTFRGWFPNNSDGLQPRSNGL